MTFIRVHLADTAQRRSLPTLTALAKLAEDVYAGGGPPNDTRNLN